MRRSTRVRPQVTGILDSIRRIIRDLRQSSRISEQRYGIGGAQLFVLEQLAEAPAQSVNQLAERTYTHQSSVSVVVRRLVEQGLVETRESEDDRRRRELRLTAAGKRLAARAPETAQHRLIHALLQLPAAQQQSLERVLRRVVKMMGAAGEPAEMLFSAASSSGQSASSSRLRRQLRQKTSRGNRKTRPATPRR
jgi:MarR family transcriptional regulator, lower aerobic nicotinate degradation pathway regulator